MTPGQRILRAKLAQATRAANGGYSTELARRGQAGLLARFEREVDPNGELDPVERTRRAEAARRVHFYRLALKSAQARSKRSRALCDATNITTTRGGDPDV